MNFRSLCCGLLLFTAAAAAQPPVILISIDTLRADHLSAYGYTRIRTPNIDSFAQGGTQFDHVDAQIPLTLPSHTSLFTSTYPFENRIEENAERVPEGVVTLASVLKSHGYQTAAFIASVFLEREMGIGQGFDFYDSPFHFAAFSPLSGSMFFGGAGQNPYGVRDRRDGALVIGAAIRWLNAHQGQPVMVFIHLFDLHKPYIRGGYDAELLYVDHLLGNLKQSLAQRGWWDKSLVALFSDHGEGLGDHGEASHGYFVYQSTLHVPLLVHWPAGSPPHPARDPRPAGLIDVAPSILDALHIPSPSSFEGKSMLSDPPRFVFAESVHAHDAFGWAPLRSLRVGPLKYIDAPKPELYNLQDDPLEKVNLMLRAPEKAAELQGTLRKLLIRYAPRQTGSPDQVSPATRALLGSLGYLASGPKTATTASGADPKDKLAEFQLYEQAQVSLFNRRLDEAIVLLSKLLASDPKNLLARRDLGGAYLDRQLYAKARACFEQVLAAAPDDYVAHFELGIADRNLGLLKEARSHLEAACKIAPDAAQCRAELEKTK
jgi:tetratricopeptide (TPR) repeat protein